MSPNARVAPFRLLLALVSASLLAGPALADELDSQTTLEVPPLEATPAGEGPVSVAARAEPEFGEDDEFDWLRLNSGEWLKGNVDRMRDGKLEFDSAELDGLKIDWSDVAEMRSPQQNTYVFEDELVVTGAATVNKEQILIQVAGAPQAYDRSLLLAIIDGTATEKNYWSGGAGLGFNARTGNTESVDISANAWIRREDANTRLKVNYLGAFGTLSGTENTNNHRVREQLDWFVTRRFYVIPIMFDFYNDKFQNIAYRLTPAVGAGYEIYKRGSVEWNVIGGFGYQQTRFSSVAAGADKSDGTAIVVFGTTFGTDITKWAEFDFLYNVYVGVPNVSETNHHAEAIFSVDLFGPVDLDLSFIFDRLEDPKPNSAGITPKKNDLQMIIGLAVDF